MGVDDESHVGAALGQDVRMTMRPAVEVSLGPYDGIGDRLCNVGMTMGTTLGVSMRLTGGIKYRPEEGIQYRSNVVSDEDNHLLQYSDMAVCCCYGAAFGGITIIMVDAEIMIWISTTLIAGVGGIIDIYKVGGGGLCYRRSVIMVDAYLEDHWLEERSVEAELFGLIQWSEDDMVIWKYLPAQSGGGGGISWRWWMQKFKFAQIVRK